MGINAVKQKGEEVALILRENGFSSDEKDLLRQVRKLESNPIGALKYIIGLCNVRALGDLNIKTIPFSEWHTHIGKLDQKSRKALRELPSGKT